MDDWKVTLKAGEQIQEVLDVLSRKILSDVVGSADDLVIREAEENQSTRDLFERIVRDVPTGKWRGIARAVGMNTGIYSCVHAVRVAERWFGFELGLKFGFDWDLGVGDGRIIWQIAGLGRLLVEHVRPVLSGGWLLRLHGVVAVAVRGIIIAQKACSLLDRHSSADRN